MSAFSENFKLIDFSKEIVIERRERRAPRHSNLPCPRISTDSMEPVQHPCTGEYYSSKARFREVTRANGCVEVGNDPARLKPFTKPKPDRQSIRKSIEKAAAIVAAR